MKPQTFVLPLMLLSACASVQPLPKEKADRVFTCKSATLKDAERNLATSGFALLTVTDQTLTTSQLEVPVATPHEKEPKYIFLATAAETYKHYSDSVSVQVVVISEGEGIRIVPRFVKVDIITGRIDTVVANGLFDEQLSHEPTMKFYNRLRKMVCGDNTNIDL